jgi:hypothetical protein
VIREICQVVGALTIIASAASIAVVLILGYRTSRIRRPYRDEHQGT